MNDAISTRTTMTLLGWKNNGIKFKCHDFYGGRFLILRNATMNVSAFFQCHFIFSFSLSIFLVFFAMNLFLHCLSMIRYAVGHFQSESILFFFRLFPSILFRSIGVAFSLFSVTTSKWFIWNFFIRQYSIPFGVHWFVCCALCTVAQSFRFPFVGDSWAHMQWTHLQSRKL